MKKSRAFRPAAGDRLEDRTVPSGFEGGFEGWISSLPAQDARAVAQAIQTFEMSYVKDVQTILYAGNASIVPTSTARAAFDTQVATDLNTLNSSIDTAIANITTTSNPTLVQTIHDDLLGTASTSLQTELTTVATPTTAGWRGMRQFIYQSWNYVGPTAYTVVNLVRTATPPAGTITGATAQTILSNVATSFQTFVQGYFNAVQTAATNPATNRAAFDAQVATLIDTLNTSITGSFTSAGLPTTLATSLTQTITNDLLTGTQTTGTSLQARLGALTSPSSNTGFAAWWFDIRSLRTIYGAQGQVVRDIVTAINTYNGSLTG